jgi:hypothetical protein
MFEFETTYHQDIELRKWVLHIEYFLIDGQRTNVDVQRELSSPVSLHRSLGHTVAYLGLMNDVLGGYMKPLKRNNEAGTCAPHHRSEPV